jgi:nucleotide-binding universal stress UspA family protein
MYKNLLIASDGSELAGKAVTHGLKLAKALGAKVTAVNVSDSWTAFASAEISVPFPIEEYERACEEAAQKVLTEIAARAKAEGVACDTIHVKDQFAAEGIIETAKARGSDLIVMASHGRRGVSRLLLGSQANRVVTHSEIPVLICR